jgi:hypothetical protein
MEAGMECGIGRNEFRVTKTTQTKNDAMMLLQKITKQADPDRATAKGNRLDPGYRPGEDAFDPTAREPGLAAPPALTRLFRQKGCESNADTLFGNLPGGRSPLQILQVAQAAISFFFAAGTCFERKGLNPLRRSAIRMSMRV